MYRIIVFAIFIIVVLVVPSAAEDIFVKDMEEMHLASLEYYGSFHKFTGTREELLTMMAAAAVKPEGHCLVIIHDYPATAKVGGYFSADVCYPIGEQRVGIGAGFQEITLPQTSLLCIEYQGEYSDIMKAYDALLDQAWKGDYRITGDLREILLAPPGAETPPTVEVQLPVETRKEYEN